MYASVAVPLEAFERPDAIFVCVAITVACPALLCRRAACATVIYQTTRGADGTRDTEVVIADITSAASTASWHFGLAVALEAFQAALAILIVVAVALTHATWLGNRAARAAQPHHFMWVVAVVIVGDVMLAT